MSGKHGINIYFEVQDPIGLSWIRPAKQEAGTLNRTMDPVDVTNKDSAKWKESIGGDRGWDMAFTALFDELDAGYLILEAAWEDDTELQVRGWDGTRFHTGAARVGDMGIDAPDDDAARYSPTITGTGVLTIT